MNLNYKAIQTGLALFFAAVAVASSVELVRFNNYIDTTISRDQHQEQCITDTLEALTHWVEFRKLHDPPSKTQFSEYFNNHPLPKCTL